MAAWRAVNIVLAVPPPVEPAWFHKSPTPTSTFESLREAELRQNFIKPAALWRAPRATELIVGRLLPTFANL
jgi:hypothetical protein